MWSQLKYFLSKKMESVQDCWTCIFRGPWPPSLEKEVVRVRARGRVAIGTALVATGAALLREKDKSRDANMIF